MNPASLKGRSLLSWINYSPEEIRFLLDAALSMRRPSRAILQRRRFKGKTLGLLFQTDPLRELSSEVRAAFEIVLSEGGGHPVFLPAPASMEDAGRILGKMFDALAFTGSRQEDLEILVRYSSVPVFNIRTDAFEPLRALSVLSCMESLPGPRNGRKLAFIGDGKTAIARSLMVLCAKLGIDCSFSYPSVCAPDDELHDLCTAFAGESGARLEYGASPEAAVKDAFAIVTSPWSDTTRSFPDWQLSSSLLDATGRKDTVFIHAEPLRRGDEVLREVCEGQPSKCFDLAEHLVDAVRALLFASL